MRNYITINGIKSDSVKGLMIQSLPPISKPLVRTSTEEIDGRDGDIVTKLGYSAYDKEVTIGLHGDFDVNDAIQFFDSSGEVVFSNEPDKYYNFEILQRIDFERLIRFKTATVKFHVQPFKYSDVDRQYVFSNDFISFAKQKIVSNGVTLTANDGKITLSGTASEATEFYVKIKPEKLPASNYTLSVESAGKATGCAVRVIADRPTDAYTFGGQYISLGDNTTANLSGTANGNTTYNYIWFYINKGATFNTILTITLRDKSIKSATVINMGNIVSKPKVTIYGSGDVTLALNGTNILTFTIDEDYITIDSEGLNAYHENTLKNRLVRGDYDNLQLKTGVNTISWDGNVDSVILDNFSRWI